MARVILRETFGNSEIALVSEYGELYVIHNGYWVYSGKDLDEMTRIYTEYVESKFRLFSETGRTV